MNIELHYRKIASKDTRSKKFCGNQISHEEAKHNKRFHYLLNLLF